MEGNDQSGDRSERGVPIAFETVITPDLAA